MKSKLINLIKLGIKKKDDVKQKKLEVEKIEPMWNSPNKISKNVKIVKYGKYKNASIKNKSDNDSFKELLGYIDGKNINKQTFKMTVPVLQKFINNKNSEMFFFIFPKSEKDELPNPINDEIFINNLDLQNKYFAQIKYTSFILNLKSIDKKNYEELIQKIGKYKYNDKVYYKATYNQPFSFFKKYEIWVELEDFTE